MFSAIWNGILDHVYRNRFTAAVQAAEHELMELQAELREVKERHKLLSAAIQSLEQADANFAIAFSAMNAFSIERIPRCTIEGATAESYGVPCKSVVGYFFKDEVREWMFTCSLATHQRLVLEFKEYQAAKTKN